MRKEYRGISFNFNFSSGNPRPGDEASQKIASCLVTETDSNNRSKYS